MSDSPILRWRKSWVIENLQGSIRRDLLPSERSVWADLLDLCAQSRRWGVIERTEGIPYEYYELAQMFVTPLEVVESAINKCLSEGRLKKGSHGELVVAHWDKYQSRSSENKKERKGKVPMSQEDAKASTQAWAARAGYLDPNAARRGAEIRDREDSFVKAGKIIQQAKFEESSEEVNNGN